MKRALVLAVGLAACHRTKLPVATHVWLGPTGGCVQTVEHPRVGTRACWGALADGAPERRVATRTDPAAEAFAFDREHACVATASEARCGAFGTLPGHGELVVGAGRACLREKEELRCLGAPLDLGPGPVKSVALGDELQCAALGPTKDDAEKVVCRGHAPVLLGVPVRAVTSGKAHACALLEDHTVRCWGANESGQLGDGSTNASAVPVAVHGLTEVIAIGAGDRHTCAHLANRTMACWGANEHHQLANGTTTASGRPNVIVGLVGIRQIAVAGDGGCAIIDEGVVRCWGRNDRYQLGDGSTDEHNVPSPIRYQALER